MKYALAVPSRLVIALCLVLPLTLTAQPYVERDDVQSFMDRLEDRHGLDRDWLEEVLSGVERRQSVIDAISDPAEALPWYRYHPIFLTEERIEKGLEFWEEHEAIIRRASREFGVDPEIIVAIIGVETYYGERQGSDPVLDSLVTLAFDYEPRADFFRSELEHFFLLAEEEDLDIHELKGSYAGAMGLGQFISSSYRSYAVDFSGSGQRNLFEDPEDGIGSVANYLAEHGWRKGDLVAVPAVRRNGAEPDFSNDLERHRAAVLREAGLVFSEGVDNDARVLPIRLENEEENEWWVGLENFRVITRYNHSPLYAMAAWELAREISARRRATD